MDNIYDERVFQVNMYKYLIVQLCHHLAFPGTYSGLTLTFIHSDQPGLTIAAERQKKTRRQPPDLPCLIFTLGTSYKFLGFIIRCQRTDKRTSIFFTLIFAFDQESAFFSVQCQLFTLVASGRSSTIHLNSSMQLFWNKICLTLGHPRPT